MRSLVRREMLAILVTLIHEHKQSFHSLIFLQFLALEFCDFNCRNFLLLQLHLYLCIFVIILSSTSFMLSFSEVSILCVKCCQIVFADFVCLNFTKFIYQFYQSFNRVHVFLHVKSCHLQTRTLSLPSHMSFISFFCLIPLVDFQFYVKLEG